MFQVTIDWYRTLKAICGWWMDGWLDLWMYLLYEHLTVLINNMIIILTKRYALYKLYSLWSIHEIIGIGAQAILCQSDPLITIRSRPACILASHKQHWERSENKTKTKKAQKGPSSNQKKRRNKTLKTRNQINNTFLFQNRVKVKVVGEVSEKWN